MKNTERILWLDGFKGILCLLIFVHHFLLLFFPAIHYGEAAPSYLKGFDTYLSQSPLSVIFNGNFMVALFCIISAIVISRSIMDTENREKLAGAVVKRYFRLMMPVLGVGFITFLFSNLGMFTNVSVGEAVNSPWAIQYYRDAISFKDFMSSAFIRTWFYGDNTLSTAYWMLSELFVGSLVCMLLSVIPWKYPKASCVFYIILAYVYVDRADLMLAFILGTFIGWISIYWQKLFNPYLGACALVLGILLGGYPSGVVPENFYRYIDFMSYVDWHILGAAATVFGLFCCKFIQKILCSRIFIWLGKISYSVYLIHILILFSFTTSLYRLLSLYMGYHMAVAISFVASTAVLIATSHIYQKYAEKGYVQLQKEMFKLMENLENSKENSKEN